MSDYIRFFATGINASLAIGLVGILKNETDVLITYSAPNGDYNCRLTSRDVKELAYHELSHTSHFMQAGCGYWQDYCTRISNEIATSIFGNFNVMYGDGTETNAGVVGLGEMWGYFCQYFYTDRHYGNGGNAPGFQADLQGRGYINASGPTTHAYLSAIEEFNPNQTNDVERWIPKGLPYDLFDNRNDFNASGRFVIDNVSFYTAGQCFNALQPDARTVPAFRARLIQQTTNITNTQTLQVNELFDQYNY